MRTTLVFLLFCALIVHAAAKRGLIIISSTHEQTDLPKDLASPQLQWVYNYSPEPPSQHTYGNLSFVPMLWGEDNSNTFLSTIKAGPKFDHILSFNEPDMSKVVGGSSLNVSEAVSIWQAQIEPLKSLGYKLGSPAGISLFERLELMGSCEYTTGHRMVIIVLFTM